MESKHLINIGLIFIAFFALIIALTFTGICPQTFRQMVNSTIFATVFMLVGVGMILYWRFGPRGYKDIDPQETC